MDDFFDRAFSRRYLPQWLVAGGLVLLVVAGFVWWIQVYENPYNVWWGMLANSLATSSDTKHIVEDSAATRLDQYVGQEFGVNTLAYGRTTLVSAGNTVTTETIGTTVDDYVRYTAIKSSQKGKNGQPLNFATVLGKWARTPATDSSTPFLSQTMLGLGGGNLVPMADLTAPQRQNLLTQLHQSDIFDTSFVNVQKHKLNGRLVYTYAVDVEPVAYVALEKAFAADVGLHALDSFDPNSYQGQPAIKVELSVDVRSHRLAEVSYVGTNHQEFFSGYGVPLGFNVPHASLSAQTLQSRLSQIE